MLCGNTPAKSRWNLTTMTFKTYTELSQIDLFEDRFEYLKIGGSVGQASFGFDRYINQSFYASSEWRYIRRQVILRDNGCDLGVSGFEINTELLVHHINPMSAENITDEDEWILNPEYLITTTKTTHNAIHYGDASLIKSSQPTQRFNSDTKLW